MSDKDLIRQTIDEMLDTIPGIIPRELGQAIRDKLPNGAVWIHSIPILGSFYVTMEYQFVPNGSIYLQLKGPNGERLWVGTLRPAK